MEGFRFIVGIDLGTSSCALSYIDRYSSEVIPKNLLITQFHEQGTVELETLPSFCYVPKNQKDAENFKLPFSTFPQTYAVGILARERLLTHPDFVVHSAKSWLCHKAVDREAKILPWHSDSLIGDKRLSPVFVSSLYLRHLKDVWDEQIARGREDFRLEKQKIIVTVPASFDEFASHLTLEAAKLAGLGEHVTLCEEPQAAFYDVLSKYKNEVKKDKNILVVDVGGGTSDFCLFRTGDIHEQGPVSMERIAVSEHILLGGDNIDLSLAYLAETKLQSQGVEKWNGEKWARLVAECRRLKELVLSKSSYEKDALYYLSLQVHSGSKLLGQTKTLTFTHQEILDTVLEGFFPFCGKEEKPYRKTLALKEWGLPYAEDSAISRHLADFLQGCKVDYVLYAGGTLIPNSLQQRLTDLISSWQDEPPIRLENHSLELAVSRGASVFGFKLMREESEVLSAYPRSLYLKVFRPELKKMMLLCIVPKGFRPSQTVQVAPGGLHVLLGQLAQFELFSSLHRAEDKMGDILDEDDVSIKPVSMLQTKLGDHQKKQAVSISLEVKLGTSGLVEIYCVPKPDSFVFEKKSYRLNFSLKLKEDSLIPSTKNFSEVEIAHKNRAVESINRFFGKEKLALKLNPMSLIEDLEGIFGLKKKDWGLGLMRSLWPTLKEGLNRRGRSEQHELVWLSLAGFILRPGYGDTMDSHRVRELSSLFPQGPMFPMSTKIKNQWWIFWRRVSGGLDTKMQETIFSKIYPLIKRSEAGPEVILLLGSLERVEAQKRVALGQLLSSQILSSSAYKEQKIWALTRIANRCPLYAGPETVLRPHFVKQYLEKLLILDLKKNVGLANFLANACRRVEDRELDIDEEMRAKVLEKLMASGFEEHAKMVREYIPLNTQMMSSLLGESFPVGLIFDER